MKTSLNRPQIAIIIGFLCILSGCGQPQANLIGSGVDASLQPEVNQFELYYGKQIGNFPITLQDFSKLSEDVAPENVIGDCIVYSTGQKEIIIDSTYWNDQTTQQSDREELLFHELGHCELGLMHVNTASIINGLLLPTSIMDAIHFTGIFYQQNQTYYLNQLFGR